MCCTMDDTTQSDTSSSTASYSVEVDTQHINTPRRQAAQGLKQRFLLN